MMIVDACAQFFPVFGLHSYTVSAARVIHNFHVQVGQKWEPLNNQGWSISFALDP